MKTILICNQKGGVGKSLIADELAFFFEREGIPVAFFDMDSQGGTLHKTSEPDGAQVAIVDTPGALPEKLKSWLASADLVIVPTRPTSRDIEPLKRIRKIILANRPDVPVIYVLNAWTRFQASQDFLDWMMMLGGKILRIPQTESFIKAGAAGQSIVTYAKGSPAAKQVLALCEAVCEQLEIEKERDVNG